MRKLIIALLPVLILCGCQKDTVNEGTQDDIVRYQPSFVILGGGSEFDASAATRSLSNNSRFFPLKPFGICVLGTDPGYYYFYHELGYDNIKCTSHWRVESDGEKVSYKFQPKGSDRTEDYIGLSKLVGNVRLLALHPQPEEFDFLNYRYTPFEIGVVDSINHDYMFAESITIDVTNSADLKKPLNLKHIMSLMEFQLSTSLIGELFIENIKASAKYPNGTPAEIFYMKGTFDASNGRIRQKEDPTDVLEIEYNHEVVYIKRDPVKGPQYTSCAMIFPAVIDRIPSETESGGHTYDEGMDGFDEDIEVTIEFKFKYYPDDGNDDSEKFQELLGTGSKISFRLGDMKYNDGNSTLVGLHAGYNYKFKILVDNFIKYNGHPEIGEWKDHIFEGGKTEIEIPF